VTKSFPGESWLDVPTTYTESALSAIPIVGMVAAESANKRRIRDSVALTKLDAAEYQAAKKRLVGIETNPGPKNRKIPTFVPVTAVKKTPRKRSKPAKRNGTIHVADAQNSGMDRIVAAPAAVGNLSQPYIKFMGTRRGEQNGLRIMGYQRFTSVYDYGTTLSFVSGSTDNTNGISPTNLGKPLSLISAAFFRYKFTHLRFEFKSAMPSSTAGSITMGFDSDGNTSSYPTISQASIGTLGDSIESNIWLNSTLHASIPKDDNLYYVYAPGSDAADYRMNYQGSLLVNGTAGSTASGVVVGDIWVEYVVDLFDLGDIANLLFAELARQRHAKLKATNPRSLVGTRYYVPNRADFQELDYVPVDPTTSSDVNERKDNQQLPTASSGFLSMLNYATVKK
jgi:hypothetical protein